MRLTPEYQKKWNEIERDVGRNLDIIGRINNILPIKHLTMVRFLSEVIIPEARKLEAMSFARWISEQRIQGRTYEKLWTDYEQENSSQFLKTIIQTDD